jgi:predicted negative regulator of RcsB-dependent stress response
MQDSMKKLVVSIVLGLVMLAGASVQASDAMKAIVASYLEIQGRLAADKLDGLKPAAGAIGQQAARMGTEGMAIAKAAKAVADAVDLKTARESFGSLSDAVIAAGNAEGWKDVPDLRVAYCPMIRKSWLQKDDAIKNPYYGSMMLTCGEIKKKT